MNDFDTLIQIAELKGQIATLTHERDDLRLAHDQLLIQIHLVTADRDALKAELLQTNEYYYAATDEVTNLTHERDELAKTLKELIDVATDVTDWIQKAANKLP